jgi:hypothetical protein
MSVRAELWAQGHARLFFTTVNLRPQLEDETNTWSRTPSLTPLPALIGREH